MKNAIAIINNNIINNNVAFVAAVAVRWAWRFASSEAT
jgi:hypothetical protein